MAMALILEEETLQNYWTIFSRGLVQSARLVAATELIDGSSLLTGPQVCNIFFNSFCAKLNFSVIQANEKPGSIYV